MKVLSPSRSACRRVPPGPSSTTTPSPVPATEATLSAAANWRPLFRRAVIPGGGENRSDAPRAGLNITYCLSWLRQEENQFLSCPPHIAKDLDPKLTDLLGYTMGNYALGYYSHPEMVDGLPDTLPPEIAIGRGPDQLPKDSLISGEVPIDAAKERGLV